MITSASGVAFIKAHEGLETKAYVDIAGILTIGYGHTGADVERGTEITEAQAETLLRQDLDSRELRLSAWSIEHDVALNRNEYDALISFIYNIGWDAFEDRSTTARRLIAGDRIGAADALAWWNKATVAGVFREVQGLTRRRAAEKELFLTPMREIKPASNTARLLPLKEHPPAWRFRWAIFDRMQLWLSDYPR